MMVSEWTMSVDVTMTTHNTGVERLNPDLIENYVSLMTVHPDYMGQG